MHELIRICSSEKIISRRDAEAQRKGVDMNLRVILEPSEDGGFTVTVPSLPGCISEGETRDEAIVNISEAIELR